MKIIILITTAALLTVAQTSFSQCITFNYDSAGNQILLDTDPLCCEETISTFPMCLTFEAGLQNWEQDADDDIDWTLRSGSTPSYATGPNAASEGDFYIYTEASYGNSNKTARLTSSCLDFTFAANPSLSFDYHMYGSSMGSLKVELLSNGNWIELWTLSGNLGNDWFTEEGINLSAYTGQIIKLRFVGLTGSSYRSDMALDNICINTELELTCDETTSDFPACDDFEEGFGSWVQETNDDFDWTSYVGRTPTFGTGPLFDPNGNFLPSIGQGNDKYIYIEADGNNPNKTALLTSTCYDLSSIEAPHVLFDFHKIGSSSGTLTLQVSNHDNLWQDLWVHAAGSYTSEGYGAPWHSVDIDLDEFEGQSVKFRWKGQTSIGNFGDMLVDNFCVKSGPIDADFNPENNNTVSQVRTGLQEDEFETLSVNVFPNPTSRGGSVTLQVNNLGENTSSVQVELMDMTGRIVLSKDYNTNGSDLETQFNIPLYIGTGSYLVKLTTNSTVKTTMISIAQ